MEYFVVCLVALIASGLTLFSGFGVGTILLRFEKVKGLGGHVYVPGL